MGEPPAAVVAEKRTASDQQRTPSLGSLPFGQTTPGIEPAAGAAVVVVVAVADGDDHAADGPAWD